MAYLGPLVNGLTLHTARLQRRDEILPAGLERVCTDCDRFQSLVAFQKFKTLCGRENLEEQLDEKWHIAKVIA